MNSPAYVLHSVESVTSVFRCSAICASLPASFVTVTINRYVPLEGALKIPDVTS